MVKLAGTEDKYMKKVNIYTDGACSGNPGSGGGSGTDARQCG